MRGRDRAGKVELNKSEDGDPPKSRASSTGGKVDRDKKKRTTDEEQVLEALRKMK